VARGAVLATAAGTLLAACSSSAPAVSPSARVTAAATSTAMATVTAAPSPPASGARSGLTPEAMTSGLPPDLTGLPTSDLRVLVVTGDVIPARLVNLALRRLNDYGRPFRSVAPLLAQGDLRLIDLEAPLLASCPVVTTGFTFCGDARVADGMAAAGISIANLANNHLGNYGPRGIQETEAVLDSHGIAVSGLGHVAVREVRGLRFAVIGFNLVGAHFDEPAVREQIARARGLADVVVVEYHWGREYETFPLAAAGLAPDDPRVVGRATIDDGADLVIGNHPHCVQGAELYHAHLITYAHGNLLFDQHWSTGTQQSVVGRYVFAGARLVAVQYLPVRITGDVEPRPLDPRSGEGRAVLDRMLRSMHELAGASPPRLDGPGINDACP
jgi:poly-gamma-glutamate synthesis protein (capsule biosynthesis protein)